MGIMGGVGIGLIIGGIVGYSAKGSAIKAERKRQELERLRREKEELERRAAQAERMSQPDYDPQAEELRKAARFFTRK